MQFYGQSVILGMEVIVPMKVLLTRLPVPVGCVALGLIGLAVLLSGYSTLFLWIFGLCSILLQLLLVLKCCLPGQLRTACGDCVTLSTLAGYSMALMLTSVQLKTFLPYAAAFVLWRCGLLLHLIIIVLFSRKLLRERPSAFAARGSWLLVYVGIAAASISASAFGANAIGRILLIPAALGALILVPLILRAELKSSDIPVAQKPLFCIIAAPVSIWICGYFGSVPECSRTLVAVLLPLSQLFYLLGLWCLIKTCRQPFSPAFAAFTFPFVISATALKKSCVFLGCSGAFRVLIPLEILIALAGCLFAFFGYFRFLLMKRA